MNIAAKRKIKTLVAVRTLGFIFLVSAVVRSTDLAVSGGGSPKASRPSVAAPGV